MSTYWSFKRTRPILLSSLLPLWRHQLSQILKILSITETAKQQVTTLPPGRSSLNLHSTPLLPTAALQVTMIHSSSGKWTTTCFVIRALLFGNIIIFCICAQILFKVLKPLVLDEKSCTYIVSQFMGFLASCQNEILKIWPFCKEREGYWNSVQRLSTACLNLNWISVKNKSPSSFSVWLGNFFLGTTHSSISLIFLNTGSVLLAARSLLTTFLLQLLPSALKALEYA